jgi:hypothetical protein
VLGLSADLLFDGVYMAFPHIFFVFDIIIVKKFCISLLYVFSHVFGVSSAASQPPNLKN